MLLLLAEKPEGGQSKHSSSFALVHVNAALTKPLGLKSFKKGVNKSVQIQASKLQIQLLQTK